MKYSKKYLDNESLIEDFTKKLAVITLLWVDIESIYKDSEKNKQLNKINCFYIYVAQLYSYYFKNLMVLFDKDQTCGNYNFSLSYISSKIEENLTEEEGREKDILKIRSLVKDCYYIFNNNPSMKNYRNKVFAHLDISKRKINKYTISFDDHKKIIDNISQIMRLGRRVAFAIPEKETGFLRELLRYSKYRDFVLELELEERCETSEIKNFINEIKSKRERGLSIN